MTQIQEWQDRDDLIFAEEAAEEEGVAIPDAISALYDRTDRLIERENRLPADLVAPPLGLTMEEKD